MAKSEFQKLMSRIKSANDNNSSRFYIGQVQNLNTWVLRDMRGCEISPRHTSLQALFIWCNNNGYAPYKSPVSNTVNPLMRVRK